MKIQDFLVCKFSGDTTVYVAEITKISGNYFECKFLHSGSIYEFEIVNWTVTKKGKTFPVGTPLSEYKIYSKSDHQIMPGEGKEQLFICVTFGNGGRYLGILTETTPLLFSRYISFIHSKAQYVFTADNIIDQSGGIYKVGEKIKGIEIYVPALRSETFTEEEGEIITVEKGALSTNWKDFFKNFTIEEMKESIDRGSVLLNNMIYSTVAKAKIISHATANPVTAKGMAEDVLKAGFDAITLNEMGFVKNAASAVFSMIFGSFVEIIRAHESWDVAKTRGRLYDAYIDGCIASLFPNSDAKPTAIIEKSFFDFGLETINNLTTRKDLSGDTKVMSTEFMRGDLIAALVEKYRLWEHESDFTIERYRACFNNAIASYRGFVHALKSQDNLTDD